MSGDGTNMKRLAELRAQRRAGTSVGAIISSFLAKLEQVGAQIQSEVLSSVEQTEVHVDFLIDEYFACRVIVEDMYGKGVDTDAVLDVFERFGMPKSRVVVNHRSRGIVEFMTDLPSPTAHIR